MSLSRFSGPQQLTGSAATVYTAPAAGARIDNIHVSNPSGATVTFTLSVGTDATASRMWDAYQVPAGGMVEWNVYLVLDAGEIIQAFASTGGVLDLTLDGATFGAGGEPGTFGNTGTGNSSLEIAANWTWSSLYPLSEAGDVSKLSLYCRNETGIVTRVKCAIYSNSGGVPNTLLATSNEVTGISTTLGWVDFTFASPVSLSADSYWLVFNHIRDSGTNFFVVGLDTTGGTGYDHSDSYSDGFQSPWTGGATNAYDWCIYASYVGGGGDSQTSVAEVSLASGSAPTSRTLHSLHVRARTVSGAGTIRMALYEGSTNITDTGPGYLETTALTTSLADYSVAIADADAAAIGSYANLGLRFWGYAAGGGAIVYEVDQIWLETPPTS